MVFDDTGSVLAPASKAAAITPSDSTDLGTPTRWLYLGVGGDVRVTLLDDANPVTFVGLAAGVVHPLRVKRVYAAQTTATNIIGVY